MRVLGFQIICVEFHRSTAILYWMGVVCGKRVIHVINRLRGVSRFSKFYQIYTEIYLVFKQIEDIVQQITYIAISVYFWGCVAMVWIIIKCFRAAEVGLVYSFIVLTFTFIMPLGSVTLKLLCKVMETTKDVAARQRLLTKLNSVYFKTVGNKINYEKAQSVFPVRIKYGFFG